MGNTADRPEIIVQMGNPAGGESASITRVLIEQKITGKCGHAAEAVAALLDDLARLLSRAARENFSVQHLLDALAGEGVADEAVLDVFAGFWKDECKRVRGVLAARASFNGALAKTSWRVDIVTHASGSALIERPRSSFTWTAEAAPDPIIDHTQPWSLPTTARAGERERGASPDWRCCAASAARRRAASSMRCTF